MESLFTLRWGGVFFSELLDGRDDVFRTLVMNISLLTNVGYLICNMLNFNISIEGRLTCFAVK